MILSSGRDETKSAHSPWLELVEARFDIRTGLLKMDPLLGASAAGMAGRDSIPEVLVHRVPCETKREVIKRTHRVPIGEIPGRVIAAEPVDFPSSAQVFGRDNQDLPVVSVSRLEAIDAHTAGTYASGDGSRIDISLAQRGTGSLGVTNLSTPNDETIDPDMASTLGTLVHYVLEQIKFQNTNGWQDLLQQAVTSSQTAVNDAAIEQARSMLSRFLNSSIATELAAAKSMYREIDFLLPWPGQQSPLPHETDRPTTLIAGVIDLLVESETGWHVLDYKTGDFNHQTSDEQLLRPYELQLGVYAYAVEQWFGAVPCELSLITFKPEIRRISLNWTKARWDRIRTRVDLAITSLKRPEWAVRGDRR